MWKEIVKKKDDEMIKFLPSIQLEFPSKISYQPFGNMTPTLTKWLQSQVAHNGMLMEVFAS